jgi:hypothetical protein
MADLRPRKFRLWPWRQRRATSNTPVAPPAARELAEKLSELVHLERGVAALYYYLPDEALANLARTLCQAHQSQNISEQGVDRELRTKDATLQSWRAVSTIWHSDIWQADELLATFGWRIIEALRAQNEMWSVVVDPRAKFFGLATATDDNQRYWFVLVTGERGQEVGDESVAAAR